MRRIDRQHPLVGRDGSLLLAAGRQDDAQVEVGARMCRRGVDRGAVQRLGLRQLAGFLAGVAFGNQRVGADDVVRSRRCRRRRRRSCSGRRRQDSIQQVLEHRRPPLDARIVGQLNTLIARMTGLTLRRAHRGHLAVGRLDRGHRGLAHRVARSTDSRRSGRLLQPHGAIGRLQIAGIARQLGQRRAQQARAQPAPQRLQARAIARACDGHVDKLVG